MSLAAHVGNPGRFEAEAGGFQVWGKPWLRQIIFQTKMRLGFYSQVILCVRVCVHVQIFVCTRVHVHLCAHVCEARRHPPWMPFSRRQGLSLAQTLPRRQAGWPVPHSDPPVSASSLLRLQASGTTPAFLKTWVLGTAKASSIS